MTERHESAGPARGLFIVIEGPDGAGKSTLVERLGRRLTDLDPETVVVRQPGGTRAAEIARHAAFDPVVDASAVTELFLVLAARADLVAKVIRPALHGNRVVLSDRHELSTLAYQVAGRGLPRDAVVVANRLATGGLEPDLTIILDVPPEIGRARQAESGKVLDRMERESADLHETVAGVFREAVGPNIVHVDGTQTPDEVERAAWQIIRERLHTRVASGPE